MNYDIILLGIGIFIVVVTIILSFVFKEKRNDNIRNYSEGPNADKNRIYQHENLQLPYIYERIDKLEQEILELKQENNLLKDAYKKNNLLLSQNEMKTDKFKPILNYNLFKEKNSKIIDLYEKGKSKEEIAKILNKSIREVEMVLKLLK